MKQEVTVGKDLTLSRKEALEIAATAWCGEETKNKIMDCELASEFAKILEKEVNYRVKNALAVAKYFPKGIQCDWVI